MNGESRYLLLLFALLAGAGALFLNGSLRRKREDRQRRERKLGITPVTAVTRLADLNRRRKKLLSDMGIKTPAYLAITAAGAAAGACIGRFLFRELIFTGTLAVLGAAAPILLLGYRRARYRGRHMDDLVASMAILSNSFLMTDDLVSSVRENTERLPLPEPFRAFLTYVECIDGNVAAGLHRLGRHVDNLYFSEWVDVLILAQEDRSMKYAALPVVEMLHDLRQAQGEADTVMYGIWYEYLTVLALIFCAPLVLRLLMPDAYGILVTSPVGKALLFALIAAVVYSLLRAAALNKPLVS